MSDAPQAKAGNARGRPGRLRRRVAACAARLWRDRAGNTLALIAAAIIPLIALVGSGIDMGRAYLAQTRLQAACDAGVLAARKKINTIPNFDPSTQAAPVVAKGQQFFNDNFPDASYGTAARNFTIQIQPDLTVDGAATVSVPTTIMQIFGFGAIPINTPCQARLNFANTDVMMVLDTTGSMADTNPGDSKPKIAELRDVVKSFYTQLETSKTPGTRIRYGFVPYSTNVNVGYLLQSNWMVNSWAYQSRFPHDTGTTEIVNTSTTTYNVISGTAQWVDYVAAACPPNTATWTTLSTITNPDGSTTTRVEVNGDDVYCAPGADGGFHVTGTHYVNYIYDVTTLPATATRERYIWEYRSGVYDTTFIKGANPADPTHWGMFNSGLLGWPGKPDPLPITYSGCILERHTYEIGDYTNVDFTQARDLDLDGVPDPANPDTQWRPLLDNLGFERSKGWDGSGAFTVPAVQADADFLMANWAGYATCPAPAQKLQEMAPADVDAYLSTLYPDGSTYHDIGMIWGGRLLSPTGLFAADNADQPGKATGRHLIFLTDGYTDTLDVSYGAYGIEPLDRLRWSPSSPLTLNQVVESRFTVACNEVKKRNITVWVIGFGTTLNPVLTQCAGPGHSFAAQNASQLSAIFANIAGQLGSLRITR